MEESVSRPFVWSLIGCLVAAIAVSATYAYPQWPLDVGLDFWNAPEAQHDLDYCRRVGEELEQQRQLVEYRLEYKREVANQVFARRLTLEEAGKRFRELGVYGPAFFSVLRRLYPGVSDDELLCRNVIDTVKYLPISAEESARAVAGLERQLRALKQRSDGQVRLPD
jgi:hypothetical protein